MGRQNLSRALGRQRQNKTISEIFLATCALHFVIRWVLLVANACQNDKHLRPQLIVYQLFRRNKKVEGCVVNEINPKIFFHQQNPPKHVNP
jgi:hypothetical protein